MHIDDSKKLDKRNIQRNIKDKIVTQKEYDAYLSKLPDVADKVFVPESESKEPDITGDIELNRKRAPERRNPKGNRHAHLRVSMQPVQRRISAADSQHG